MIELIPAIDIIDGKCVRLAKGDYNSMTVYADDPVGMAKSFEDIGFKRLHLVDLDGAKSGHTANTKVLEGIAKSTNLEIDFGGGIRTDGDVQKAFDSGARIVTIGSVSVSSPEKCLGWIEKYGADKIIIGADVRNGTVSVNGWQEDSSKQLLPFLDFYIRNGAKNVLCTEISKDGMMGGPALALYRQLMAAFPCIHLIASGGVSRLEDIQALEANGIPGVVFGKALYEGKLNLKELWAWQNA